MLVMPEHCESGVEAIAFTPDFFKLLTRPPLVKGHSQADTGL